MLYPFMGNSANTEPLAEDNVPQLAERLINGRVDMILLTRT
jgi:hypothetical protein